MILLDTDHLSVLKYDEHPRCRALRERMGRSQGPFFATTIIAAEEQMRGWLAKIHGAKDAEKQVAWYDQLAWLIEFLADWQIIAFDQPAAEVGCAMGYPEGKARQSVWQFLNKVNDRRVSSLRRFAKALGIAVRDLF